jgi:hypothetical protein
MGRRKKRIAVKADLDRARNGSAAENSRPDAAGAVPEASLDDLEQYLHHLGHLDMALPLKLALIRSVRDLMQSFVDRAFGDDPAQLARQAGGNWNEPRTDRADGMIGWPSDNPDNPHMLTSDFRQNAEAREEKEIDT